MDDIWNELTSKSLGTAVICLVIYLSAMTFWMVSKSQRQIERMAQRFDDVELERSRLEGAQAKQIESIQTNLSELQYVLQDLKDFQKGEGRYRYNPSDPRLPTHIRDQTGRDD
ncbi:hypothetical protein SAMN04490189_4620 [Pseudomonas koreensis]|uniref:hypothetical protein n=1 Tax=Pseudomonas koreensis TaxID=198620 RepID=UPI00087A336C|nr:hypothetical protein [Pseudomonas koreensis]KAB0510894.1 hypothetical protein F7R05_22085 [Pseudomonas koreensis]NNA64360.1 hypothetical protein [Pseudomonas koreensis]GGK52911.1 hypothetical protein GCM10009103_54090 [Pseudomonas koreensis]SDE19309.1 hypothetical protein SAMN04490189_4620 [Pseudomonas koreensis]